MSGFPESPMCEDVPAVNPIISTGQKKCSKCGEMKLIIQVGKRKTRVCRECKSAYFKAYRKAHKQEIAEKSRASYLANREERIKQTKAYYNAHKKEAAEYFKNYRTINKEKETAQRKAYYETHREELRKRAKAYYEAHKNDATAWRKSAKGKAVSINTAHKRRSWSREGDVATDQLKQLLDTAKKCYWCGSRLTKDKGKNIDHYIPLSKGGRHTLSNLVVSCVCCNLSKHAKDPYKYAETIGRLL